ncbi:2OG-Fe(II) oxygenase [Alteromonas gracilis]|uniref:2OG-Fe(II) oxygenase n=1 Tax=Alteromonas gracilis TaxID=1479524 RepID=UPI0030D0EA0F
MNRDLLALHQPLHVFEESLFENIVEDLVNKGFSIQKNGLPDFILNALATCQETLHHKEYKTAGIGRADDFQHVSEVRGDTICWITGSSQEGALWLAWCDALKLYINRTLFMGLFSFESHFACYEPGKFYKRHVDAFRGQSNRVLSLVAYLNEDWQPDDGGELILYRDEEDIRGISVTPQLGTFVVFLSEQFPHEVLPAVRPRHSVAGWFRVNGSVNDNIDPPK